MWNHDTQTCEGDRDAMKNNIRNIEVSKNTGDKFTISKTIWEAENRKKITNDEYLLILIGEK